MLRRMRELKWRAERMRPTSSRRWFGQREGWEAFSVRPCRRKPIRPSSHLRCWFRILKTDYLIVFKQHNNESFAARKKDERMNSTLHRCSLLLQSCYVGSRKQVHFDFVFTLANAIGYWSFLIVLKCSVKWKLVTKRLF